MKKANFDFSPGCNDCQIDTRHIQTTSPTFAAILLDIAKSTQTPARVEVAYEEMSFPQKLIAAVQFAGGMSVGGDCELALDGSCPKEQRITTLNLKIADFKAST
jgi:hypothetical protein